ncbi:hypothetical protein [Nannocystis sp.]|uniref:hypothetical protein n=1 Tax=Nannocystis sp. TaxID=1962667 RepID=UPI0025CCF630|nr:hypothetical protein [Nannocystis sp.]MBK7828360.1 hypothetical protein [Nannocystis sp.]
MLPGLLPAALAAILHAPPPAAEGRPVDLRWDAPKRCPDEAALRLQVDEILGGSLALPRPRPLSVIAVVRDEGETLSLRVFTVGEAGMRERALRYDRDCELLTRAAAVVIAITIDPASIGRLGPDALTLLDPSQQPVPALERAPTEAPLAAPEPTPPSPTPVSPIPEPAPPAPTPPPAATPRAPTWRPRGSLRALGGLGVGELPGVGGGVSVAASLVFRHLRLELVASLWPARHLRLVGTDADSGADFLLWSLGPRLCGVLHPHRLLELPLCAGAEAGQVQVTGVGLQDNRRQRVTWMAGVFAPSLVVVPLRRLALWLAPELLVPSRASYTIEEIGPIFRAQPVAGRFMAGIELRLP